MPAAALRAAGDWARAGSSRLRARACLGAGRRQYHEEATRGGRAMDRAAAAGKGLWGAAAEEELFRYHQWRTVGGGGLLQQRQRLRGAVAAAAARPARRLRHCP